MTLVQVRLCGYRRGFLAYCWVSETTWRIPLPLSLAAWFPKGWMLRVCLWSSHLHVRGCWHLLYAARFHLYGSALSWQSAQNISVKHSLASAEKLLLASRSHQWWIRYNGLEELLLQSIFSVHYGVTSPQRFAIWICHYLFSQCKYFRAVTSSRKKKKKRRKLLLT